MPLIYITGIAGAGKSTVRLELRRRGYRALGGLEDGLAAFYDNRTGERLDGFMPVAQRTPEWLAAHTWRLPREVIEQLRESVQGELLFVCAYAPDETTQLWDLFDKVFALTIDEQTLRERVAKRTNNDVGKSEHELASILERQQRADAEYARLGATMIDSRKPTREVVNEILTACSELVGDLM
jgi:dephospho-CoA kinase